jgi:tetratricopeptide (TPR) repeat protein
MSRKGDTKGGKGGKKKAEHTPQQLVDQGMVALSRLEPELASTFFQRALALSPEDTNIMDALADTYIQIGEPEQALPLLQASVALAPTENVFKWLYLAQLQQARLAVATYGKAIELMTELVQSETDEVKARIATKQIAKAYCGIAELFLTDLW